MSGMSGNYDGEGPNVTATPSATAPGAVAKSPDVWAKRGAMNNGIPGGQGIGGFVPVDRVGRMRVSNEAARKGTAISVGGGDQILDVCTRWVYIGTTGNLVVRLADDTADTTLSNLPVGMYSLAVAIVRQTGSTAAGVLLF